MVKNNTPEETKLKSPEEAGMVFKYFMEFMSLVNDLESLKDKMGLLQDQLDRLNWLVDPNGVRHYEIINALTDLQKELLKKHEIYAEITIDGINYNELRGIFKDYEGDYAIDITIETDLDMDSEHITDAQAKYLSNLINNKTVFDFMDKGVARILIAYLKLLRGIKENENIKINLTWKISNDDKAPFKKYKEFDDILAYNEDATKQENNDTKSLIDDIRSNFKKYKT